MKSNEQTVAGGRLRWQLSWEIDNPDAMTLRALRDEDDNPIMISPVMRGPHEGEYMLWWPDEGDRIAACYFTSVYDAAKAAEEIE